MRGCTVRRARISDVLKVFEDVSEITREELERLGHTPWTAMKYARHMLKKGKAVALVEGDDAIMVFGCVPSDVDPDGTQYTWFMASQRFVDKGAAGVLWARKFLRRWKKRFPEKASFVSITAARGERVDRWFRLQGFRRLGDSDSRSVYCYVES